MQKNLKIALLGTAAAFAVSGGIRANSTFAASSTASDSLIAKIAARFNLAEADVQAVFDENRSEMEANRAQRFTDRLTQAVADGTLTEAQKSLILTKQTEVQEKMEEIRALTDDTARHTAMTSLRSDLTQWATDNGVDRQWLPMRGGPGGHGRGMMGGPGGPPDTLDGSSTSSTPAT